MKDAVHWQSPGLWAPPRGAPVPQRADAVVLGAGLTGLAAALAMSTAGLRVVVLERGRVGNGASGRNGGQVLTGLAPSYGEVSEAWGAQAPALWAQGAAAVRELAELVQRHHITCDWHQGGHLAVAASRRRWRALAADAERLDAAGLALQVLDAAETARRLGWPGYVGSLFDPRSATVNPYRLTVGLAQAAVQAGAAIIEQAPGAIEAAPGGFRVRTGRVTVAAREVVVAANAFLPSALPPLAGRIRRVTSHMLATTPLPPEAAARLLLGRPAVYEESARAAHFQLTPDRRLVFGSRVPAEGAGLGRGRGLAAVLRHLIPEPLLDGVAVDTCWAGPIALTPAGLPTLGQTPAGVRWVGAYSGHGVALSVRLGSAVGRWVATGELPAWPQGPPAAFPDAPLAASLRATPAARR